MLSFLPADHVSVSVQEQYKFCYEVALEYLNSA